MNLKYGLEEMSAQHVGKYTNFFLREGITELDHGVRQQYLHFSFFSMKKGLKNLNPTPYEFSARRFVNINGTNDGSRSLTSL